MTAIANHYLRQSIQSFQNQEDSRPEKITTHYKNRIDENYDIHFSERFTNKHSFNSALKKFTVHINKEISHKIKFILPFSEGPNDIDHKVLSKFRQFLKENKLGKKGYTRK